MPDVDEPDKTKRIAFDLLGVRDRSVKEMRERLQRRGCPAAAIDTVVADLEALRLLDDHAFVRKWIESRRERRPEGTPKIARDLMRRGVARAVVDEVLSEFDGQIGTEDEAVTLLRRQRPRYHGLDQATTQRRMYGLLARRGFDPDTVREAVDHAWSEIESESQQR